MDTEQRECTAALTSPVPFFSHHPVDSAAGFLDVGVFGAEKSRLPRLLPAAVNRTANFIEAALAKGRNAMSIWQELVNRHRFVGAYESARRYVRKLRGVQSPEPRGIIQTAPGARACSCLRLATAATAFGC